MRCSRPTITIRLSTTNQGSPAFQSARFSVQDFKFFFGPGPEQLGREKTTFLDVTHKYCNKATVHRWNVNHHGQLVSVFSIRERGNELGTFINFPMIRVDHVEEKSTHQLSFCGIIKHREINTSTCIYIQSLKSLIFNITNITNGKPRL